MSQRLPRVMRLRDVVLFNISAIVGLRWLTTAASQFGLASLLLWLVAMVVFFLPSAVAVRELADIDPAAGGIYRWVRRAFGPLHGFVAGWGYWVNNLFYFPSLLVATAAIAAYAAGPRFVHLADDNAFIGVVSLAGLWLAVGMNVVGLRVGKRLQNLGGYGTWLPALLFVLLALWSLVTRGGATPFTARALLPATLDFQSIYLFATMTFGLAGLELAPTLGDEIYDAAATLRRGVLVSGVAIVAMYVLGTAAMLVALPRETVSITNGMPQATAALVQRLGAPGWLLVFLAAAAGAGAAALYARFGAARMVVTVLAPAPLLFLALFLFNSDASKLTLSGTPAAQAANERPRVPVVLVVFDELPLNSLLDAHGRIDRVRFPHFARLAAGSTWFVRDTTVAEGTTHAVPAILTGRFPRKGELPLYADHPQNLFTLLGDGTRLHVVDAETHLCPASLCPHQGGSFGARAGTLAEDAGIVYLHELLPRDLSHGIPSIANGWADFLQDSGGGRDPGRLDPAFVRSMRPEAKPSLWYVHVMLPHSPWAYLPSGARYSLRQAPGWGPDEVWGANQAAVDQYWQRHLLQLGYADRVLGRLVAQLRATGLYDRALLIVTADHGVSFRAGQKRRPLSPANLQDIAYVPLFVKRPGQRSARVVMAPSRNTDILPTIAAAVGVRIPWHVDGHSLLADRPPEDDVVLIKDAGRRFVVPAAALEARREAALRRQLALFGSDEPAAALFALGPDRGLLGRAFHGGRAVTDLDPIDRSGSLVQVSGRAHGRSVVVVQNGRVVAVDPIVDGRFWALAPARAPVRVFVTG